MRGIKFSKKAKSLTLGKYRHYKKKNYQVLGIVIHSETLEEMVLYKALYGERFLWVRPLKMFFEKVKIKGKVIPRFKLLGK